jgi:hypothetical protein
VDIPPWRVRGDFLDLCSCDVPCPCTFAQLPTRGSCEGINAYHVRQGHYGSVPLDEMNVIALVTFEGNAWAGAMLTMAAFIDDRADDDQGAALQAIFGGRAGGWPAGFLPQIAEDRGVQVAPVHVEVADDLATWRAVVPGRVTATAQALAGPTTPAGARAQLLNAPGSEVGPGQVVTWGVAVTDRVDAPDFAFRWEWDGRSSKHIPFDWSGPGA